MSFASSWPAKCPHTPWGHGLNLVQIKASILKPDRMAALVKKLLQRAGDCLGGLRSVLQPPPQLDFQIFSNDLIRVNDVCEAELSSNLLQCSRRQLLPELVRKSGDGQRNPRRQEVVVACSLELQCFTNARASMRGKRLSDASFLQVSFPKGWKIVVAAVHLWVRQVQYSLAIALH